MLHAYPRRAKASILFLVSGCKTYDPRKSLQQIIHFFPEFYFIIKRSERFEIIDRDVLYFYSEYTCVILRFCPLYNLFREILLLCLLYSFGVKCDVSYSKYLIKFIAVISSNPILSLFSAL
jgi:hypothetical protein